LYNEVWATKVVDDFMAPFLIAIRNGWKGWPKNELKRAEIIKKVADPSEESQKIWRNYKHAWKKCGCYIRKSMRDPRSTIH